jgi:hypothetical protein
MAANVTRAKNTEKNGATGETTRTGFDGISGIIGSLKTGIYKAYAIFAALFTRLLI